MRVGLVAAPEVVGSHCLPALTVVKRVQQPQVPLKAVGDHARDTLLPGHGLDDPTGMVASRGRVETLKRHDCHTPMVRDSAVPVGCLLCPASERDM